MVVGVPRALREGLDDRVLAHPGRPADDHEQRPGRAEQDLQVAHAEPPVGRRPADDSPARRPSSTDLERGRQRRLHADQLRRRRRHELQPPCVEEQALEAVRPLARRPRPVDRIARHGVPEGGEVDADLVGATGDEVQLQQRPRGEPLPDAVAGDGAPSVGDHRHPLAVLRVAPDRRLDPADRRRHRALDQREVGLADAAGLELGHHRCLRGVVAGDDQQARGVAVQAVDDPRPGDAGDAAVVVAAGEQRVDQRAAPVPGRRMHDQPGGLVHDQQVVVLVDHRTPRSWDPARGGTGSRGAGPRA